MRTLTFEPRVLLAGSVTQNRIGRVMQKLSDLAEPTNNGRDKIIWLQINSDGGDESHVVAFAEFLRINRIIINTIAVGNAHSSGALILQLGKERYATKKSTILFHAGSIEEMRWHEVEGSITHSKGIHRMTRQIVRNRTGLSMKEIDKLYRREQYLTPPEAKLLKLIDRIV